MSRDPHIAACQFEPDVGDIEANYDRIADLTVTLDDSVTLAVFPELCVTGYDLDTAEALATPVPGRITEPLLDIAAENNISLIAGVPEQANGALYNTLVLVDRSGVQVVYRKQYLWGAESETFEAGSGPVTADTALGKIGILNCYDLNFPEAALAYARDECDVLVVCAAWRDSYLTDWSLLLRSRAFDGTCYTIGVNQRGEQQGRQHGGHSMIVDPHGSIIENAGNNETTVTASVQRERLREARDRNPVLAYRSRRR
jgi:predicted amidohydrolase